MTQTPGTTDNSRKSMNYVELRKINVNDHIEKKNDLSYLSWAWAVDMLFQHDENANWEYHWFDGKPYLEVQGTFMVFCTVEAFGRKRTAQLPIMDYRNKPKATFDSFDLNTTMQRCLAKAISLHGIGLYIYAGEDLPPDAAKQLAEDLKAADVRPLAGAFESLEADMQILVNDVATEVGAMCAKGMWKDAYDRIEAEGFDAEAKKGLWSLLDSKHRTGIKKHAESLKQKEAA